MGQTGALKGRQADRHTGRSLRAERVQAMAGRCEERRWVCGPGTSCTAFEDNPHGVRWRPKQEFEDMLNPVFGDILDRCSGTSCTHLNCQSGGATAILGNAESSEV
jgi:hypothetical protein